ncbi:MULTISPECIES: UPF0149 family protein [Marinobacterium]|jgi:uncharacterized protein YgfB (UPF0149 family)|uniref:Uncharacterized protein n=1 Tax=Marinobacterium iners DSM 11526 TaxID=1122198 RepID=A0A1H4DYX3_9GAMM|nr:UPF0149 family protein [Marinobacterium iners]QSR33589.1 hypothetical protein CFI10_01030 [Marinobacterium iners]SEA77983.1 hypothetical protein SAMN02745729_10772 [Marinobacterium iners DSM 11526]
MTDEQAPVIELPDFDTLADLLVEEGLLTLSPAELHGLLCGQVAAGARFDPVTLFARIGELLDLEPFSRELTRTGIMQLYLATLQQLQAPDFSFELVLPDDDQPLAGRADALGLWCSGFLSGFGLQERKGSQGLSIEGQETLRDLAQIVQITTAADAEAEEDENDLMEVQEYVRMAALLVFSECNEPDGQPSDAAAETAPVLH